MRTFTIPFRHVKRRQGFTRLELFMVLAGVGLLAAVTWPLMAATNPEADRQACLNNLRAIGQALAAYAGDHDGRMPWMVPTSEGGNFGFSGAGNPWVQFLALSNKLESPRVLACPADKAKPASSWGRDADGGFLNPSFRANAVGYFIGLDTQINAPLSILAGDSNLEPTARGQECDRASVKNAASLRTGDNLARWGAGAHGEPGNLLLQDGQARTVDNAALHRLLPNTKAAHEANHILSAR